MKRRDFIKRSGSGAFLLSSGIFPFTAAIDDPNLVKLTILHTNDVHSRIDPFPMDGGRNEGKGGASKRATLIKKLRTENDNILLLDCGDIFQGTPYFNFFGGELEMKLMTEMGYDAGTIGNHDFDAGIDGLDKQLKHANFPLLVANYDLSNTVLNGKVEPYKIFNKAGLKIGVFGIGIELNSLVPKKLYKETVYLDPIENAQRTATHLKNEMDCDYVICLSHLGYSYDEAKVCDVVLAHMTKDIDLILGGHTHTFMRKPDIRRNIVGKEVVINQVGWAGLMLGKIDIVFEKGTSKKCHTCKNTFIS